MAQARGAYEIPVWVPPVMHRTLEMLVSQQDELEHLPLCLVADDIKRNEVRDELLIAHYLREFVRTRGQEPKTYMRKVFMKLIALLVEDVVVREARIAQSDWADFCSMLYIVFTHLPQSLTARGNLLILLRRSVWTFRMGRLLHMEESEIQDALHQVFVREDVPR
jgi:hypothetical protein